MKNLMYKLDEKLLIPLRFDRKMICYIQNLKLFLVYCFIFYILINFTVGLIPILFVLKKEGIVT